MMQRISFRDWILEIDVSGTRTAHGARGAEVQCDCADCRNFAVARARGLVYPSEVLAFFATAGLESAQESEIGAYGPDADGRHVIMGWLHAIGRVVDGPPGRISRGPQSWTLDLRPITESFALTFVEDDALAPDAFDGQKLVQVEFSTAIPWLLPEPDPERETPDAPAV